MSSAKGSKILASDINALRATVNAVRQRANLPIITWTDPTVVANVTQIKSDHVVEMSKALNPLIAATGDTWPDVSEFSPRSMTGVPITTDHVKNIQKVINFLAVANVVGPWTINGGQSGHVNTGCGSSCANSCSSSCTGSCDDACTGNCSTNCQFGCVNGCTTGCSGGCSIVCSVGCSVACAFSTGCGYTCSGGCSTGCNLGCVNACSTGCGGACSNTCGANCLGSCHLTCSAFCSATCTGNCSGSCSGSCNSLAGAGVMPNYNIARDGIRPTSVSAFAQGPVVWDLAWTPAKINDGIKSMDPTPAANAMASTGAADTINNGRGVTVTFNRSVALKRFIIYGYVGSKSILCNYAVEYYNGAAWVRSATIANSNAQGGVLDFNPTGSATSTQWRWFIEAWVATGNFYAFEMECYDYVPELGCVISLP